MTSSVNFHKHFDKSIADISAINKGLRKNNDVGTLFQRLFKHISKGLNSFPDNISQENLIKIKTVLTEQVEEKLQALYARSQEKLTDEKIHTLRTELAGIKATIAIQRGLLASIRALANPTQTGTPNAIAENHATYYSSVTSGRNAATEKLFPNLIFSFSCVRHALKNEPEQSNVLEEIDASTPYGMQYLTNLSVLDVLLNGHLPSRPEDYQAPVELFHENLGKDVPLNAEEKKKYIELTKKVQELSKDEIVQLQGYLTSKNPKVEPEFQDIYQEITRFGSRLIHTNSTYNNFIFQSVDKVLELQDQFNQLLSDLSDKLSMTPESVFNMLRGNPRNAIMLLKNPQGCPVLPGLDLLIKEHSNRLEVYLSRRNDIEKALPIVINELAGSPEKWNSIAQFLLEAHPLIAGFEKDEEYIRQLCKLSDSRLKWLSESKEEYQKANREFGLNINDYFFWCSEKRIETFDRLVTLYSKDKQFIRILRMIKPLIKKLPKDITSNEELEREILRLISTVSNASEGSQEYILLSHIDKKKLDTVSPFSLWVYNFSTMPQEEKQKYLNFIESYKSHIAAAKFISTDQKLFDEFMLQQSTPIDALKNEIVDLLHTKTPYDLWTKLLEKIVKQGVAKNSEEIKERCKDHSYEGAICALLAQTELNDEQISKLCKKIDKHFIAKNLKGKRDYFIETQFSDYLETIKRLIKDYPSRINKSQFVEVTAVSDLLTLAVERTDKPMDFLKVFLPDNQNKIRKFIEIKDPTNDKPAWGILELYIPLGCINLLSYDTKDKRLFNEVLITRFDTIAKGLKAIDHTSFQFNNFGYDVASGKTSHKMNEEDAQYAQQFTGNKDCVIL